MLVKEQIRKEIENKTNQISDKNTKQRPKWRRWLDWTGLEECYEKEWWWSRECCVSIIAPGVERGGGGDLLYGISLSASSVQSVCCPLVCPFHVIVCLIVTQRSYFAVGRAGKKRWETIIGRSDWSSLDLHNLLEWSAFGSLKCNTIIHRKWSIKSRRVALMQKKWSSSVTFILVSQRWSLGPTFFG